MVEYRPRKATREGNIRIGVLSQIPDDDVGVNLHGWYSVLADLNGREAEAQKRRSSCWRFHREAATVGNRLKEVVLLQENPHGASNMCVIVLLSHHGLKLTSFVFPYLSWSSSPD